MAKFKVLKDSLKWVSEGEYTVVIERLLDLLKTADMKLCKNKAELILEDDEELEEDVTDELILSLMKEICYFELFWMQRRVMPNSNIAFDQELLVADLKRCEEGLKKLEIEVNELLDASALTFGEDDHLILNESGDYKAMEAKINELWDQTEEPEAEEKRWIKKVNCEQEVNKVLEM
ncbi:uncharacterized protein LOC126653539 [Mercurialis annua]|uniref:uncharacterized protein LOC126653539 n=1 Tax=Mercurialis annua TaxID=3986 RepID=UPI0024AE40B6|nr:uncharacterized protein LOC126653539 [Mercurialis annua]